MKRLTEQQLRQVIREELKHFILEEGMAKTIGHAIGIAAMLKAMQPTAIAQDPQRNTAGYQANFEKGVDELGMKDFQKMVAGNLSNQPEVLTTIQNSSKLYDFFKQQDIDLSDTESTPNSKMADILQKHKQDPKSLSEDERKVYQARESFKSLSYTISQNDELNTLGAISQRLLTMADPSSKDTLEDLGKDMVANLSKDEKAKEALLDIFVQDVFSDLRSVGQSVVNGYTPEGQLKPTSQSVDDDTAFKLAAVYANTNDMLPNQESYSWVDVDKALITHKDKLYRIGNVNADETWNFNAKLPLTVAAETKVFTKAELEDWTNQVLSNPKYQANMYTAEYREDDSSLKKENKVNKLRQRLNELRGVYV